MAHIGNDKSLLTMRQYQKARKIRKRNRQVFLYPFYKLLSTILERSLDFFILDLKNVDPPLYYLQQSAYDVYRKVQISANVQKLNVGLNRDWSLYLNPVVSDVVSRFASQTSIRGICMGARNGSEVRYLKTEFSKFFSSNHVIGTDISDTAKSISNMVVHDFHEPLPENLNQVDFIFSNSLDQSQNPRLALTNWINALHPSGCIYLHFSRSHGKQALSNLDPFSCETELFPFVFLNWFNGDAFIERFIKIRENKPAEVLFIIKKLKSIVARSDGLEPPTF